MFLQIISQNRHKNAPPVRIFSNSDFIGDVHPAYTDGINVKDIIAMTDKDFQLHIRSVASGSKEALKLIYKEYGRMIYSAAFEVVKNRENAEDITSDFFIRLYTSAAATYTPGNGHKRWLASIAHNMAIDLLRRNSHEQLLDEDEESARQEIPDTDAPPDITVTDRITIAQAMQTLDDKERQIINLKFEADLTFRDIASVMKMPMGTVTWKYRSAIEKLRRCSDCE